MKTYTLIFGLLSTLFVVKSPAFAEESDISYGKHSQQKLDVYSGTGTVAGKESPVVVWVHGGGWRNGDKDNRSGSMLCKAWTGQGVVMVNLNYRLTPDVVHPAHVEDVAAGISWVHKNIARYGGDRKKIYLLGHSAGAHLVALVGTAPKYLDAHGLSLKSTIAGVMPIDTASFDLAASRSVVVRRMISDAFGDKPETLEEASPLQQARKHRESVPPFMIAVVKQRPEAWKESVTLSEALPKSKLVVMDYAGSGQLKAHGEIARDLMDIKNEMTKQLLTFVKEGKLE